MGDGHYTPHSRYLSRDREGSMIRERKGALLTDVVLHLKLGGEDMDFS